MNLKRFLEIMNLPLNLTVDEILESLIIYLRKSRKDMDYFKDEPIEKTLQRHEKELQDFIINIFGKPIPEHNIYREVASGDTIDDRPVMQEVLSIIEEDNIKGVVCIEIERLARGNTVDQGVIAQTFQYTDTKIITPIKIYNLDNEDDLSYFEDGLYQARKYLKYTRGCNKNYAVFPLVFCDDYDASLNAERKYFSFIGGFTESRACSAYLEFIKYSIEKNLGIKFCIATRNSIDGYLSDPIIHQALCDGTLTVQSGKPMTTEEINLHYREAVCAWNAYKISTQSGVLPNAMMQGAPVLVTDRGDSGNIVTEKKEGCFISLPLKNEEIEAVYNYIAAHVAEMSKAARSTFQKNYEYKVHLEKAKEVYEINLRRKPK